MHLNTLFKTKTCPFALEVFPPKRHSGVESVYAMLDKLGEIPCDYISVTYSAGGAGAKEYTAQIARRLKQRQGIEPLAHLTCVNAGRDEIEREVERLREAGVENILALRGDLAPGTGAKRDFEHASGLINALRRYKELYIVAACYPEGHPESRSLEEDINYLKLKLEAGAGHLVSQLFFDNTRFFSFLSKARQKGVGCPIEAGIMPIVRPEQIARTVTLSSASLPSGFTRWASRYAGSPDDFYKAGMDYAVRQARGLIEGGVVGIHLYAMNNADVARGVYEGIRDLI